MPATPSITYESQHWIRTRTSDGKEMVVVSGVAVINVKGESSSRWKRKTLTISPDLHLPPGKAITFDHWVPLVTINSVYNDNVSNDSGFAVDGFRKDPNVFKTRGRSFPIAIDVAVRDSDAVLHRVGYHLTVVGTLVESASGDDVS